MTIKDDMWFMSLALQEADRAYKEGEVPVGAVLVNSQGAVVSQSFNIKEKKFDPTGHAELLLLRSAGGIEQNWRLTDHTLYVTLEPCPMCLGAMVQARIKRCVFGAYDPKGGSLSLKYPLHQDPLLNHRFSITGGVLHYECSQLLSQFFKHRRQNYQDQ